MHVYLSSSPTTDVFSRLAYPHLSGKDADLPHFTWQNITYGDYNDHREAEFEVKFPEVSRKRSGPCKSFLTDFSSPVCTPEWFPLG